MILILSINQYLSMTFLSEFFLKSSLNISGVKPTITKDKANALMATIITKNIFCTLCISMA